MPDFTYTTLLSTDSDELEMKLYDEDITCDDLLNYISNTFRPFSDALDSFLKKYTDYAGNYDDIETKKKYIVDKYKEINYPVNPAVIKRWFTTAPPSYTPDSKEKMYALCFALGFDELKTREFFQKAYFERCFDCHNIDELVYYYCFRNNKKYQEAIQLINKLNQLIDFSLINEGVVIHTREIQKRINSISDDEQLITYVKNNTNLFITSRVSAKETFLDLLAEIQGTSDDDILIKDNPSLVCDTSPNRPIKALSILEYYKYNLGETPTSKVYSDEFLINQIFDNRNNEKKIKATLNLPGSLKSNFPSRHTLNDLRIHFTKQSKPVKNDELRKTIIVLFFYKFWCEQSLGIDLLDYDIRYNVYIDEINACISECGFEPLYIGNPFDWIFIFSAKCEDPLHTLREIYESLVEDEFDNIE